MRFCCLVLSLAGPLLAGCAIVPIPANPLPMSAAKQPVQAVALLPVHAADIASDMSSGGLFGEVKPATYLTDGWKPEALATDLNATFDAIAAGKHNKLIGPRKLKEVLGQEPDWVPLLAVEEGADEGLPRLQEEAAKVGACYLVRIRPTVSRTTHADGGGFPYGPPCLVSYWHGKVEVSAELWEVSTGQRLATRQAEDTFWGSAGNFPLVFVGHAVWKTFGRAADQATRQVLEDLTKELPATP